MKMNLYSSFKRIPTELFAWFGGIVLMLGLWYLLIHGQMDLLCALVITLTLLLASWRDKGLGAIMTLGYLTVMGDVRRIVASAFGQPKLDLLLLVAPVIALAIALPLTLNLRLKDSLSKAMLGLLLIMGLEMFNPQQGGIAVGLSGAIFYIVPILWFWLGRQFGSPAVLEILFYKCLFPLALLAACMGFVQTFIGFLPYQQAWIDIVVNTYHSLNVGNTVRAFGFSVSSAEYATLLTFGAVGCASAYLGTKKIWSLAFPVLLTAVVLASARTLILKMVFALAIVWALRSGRRLDTKALLRLGAFTVLGLMGVFFVASRAASSSGPPHGKGTAVQNALQHQAGGLAHPLDSKYSTAGTHGKMIAEGLKQGVIDPIGHGLGSTTRASAKFGDGSTGSSEVDFSDMFISLGLVGGLLYVWIIGLSIVYTLRYVIEVRKEVSLPTLGILAASLSAWLIGGQYSTSALLFFLIGGLAWQDNHGTRSRKALASRAETLVENDTLIASHAGA